jgi:hypothetical protein
MRFAAVISSRRLKARAWRMLAASCRRARPTSSADRAGCRVPEYLSQTPAHARNAHRGLHGIDVFGTDYSTSDGTCIRDFIHVKDLVLAHDAALSHLESGGRSRMLNCGYSRGFSVLEVIAAVERVSRRALTVRHAPRRPGDVVQIIADCRRLRAKLDWTPRHDDIDVIVRDAWRWEQGSAASRLRRPVRPCGDASSQARLFAAGATPGKLNE